MQDVFDSPPFEEAVTSFRCFLQQQGLSDDLRWIWRETVISRRCPGSRLSANRRIFIDRNALADEGSVKAYYDLGIERQLGIAVCVLCVAEGVPLCYIYIPEDEIAAKYGMMTSLRFKIPVPCPTATFVNHRILASMLRFLIRLPRASWISYDVPPRPFNLQN